MVKYKPVSISSVSFAFCRFSIAAVVWLSFFLRSELLLGFVCLVFLLSVILKVKNAPMIKLYDITFQRLHKRTEVMVDENSIFFAHTVGFVMASVCLALVLLVAAPGIWYVVLGFAVLKSISAMGFCPASKFYDCTLNGNCCVRKSCL